MEYTLEAYLNEHFNELEWDDELCLTLQLTDAVLCLHERDIIHRDLVCKCLIFTGYCSSYLLL